jgi:hypothetical protein
MQNNFFKYYSNDDVFSFKFDFLEYFCLFSLIEMLYFFNNFSSNSFLCFFFINKNMLQKIYEFYNEILLKISLPDFFVFKTLSENEIVDLHQKQLNHTIREDKIIFSYFAQNNSDLSNLKQFYSYNNFNSHIVYFYVLLHFFKNFPYFLLTFLYNIFNFKEMSILVNDFVNSFTV